MTVHYCDRCKKTARNLTLHRIPKVDSAHSATSYGVEEVELCDDCLSFVRTSEEAFLSAQIDVKFAFYKAIMTVSEVEK